MAKSQCPNVLFIPVNSTVSGSKTLRELNATKTIQDGLYSELNTIAAQYCKTYDGSKKNEPYYDVIAAMIASDSNFDMNFTYIPVDLITTGSNPNAFHSQQ